MNIKFLFKVNILPNVPTSTYSSNLKLVSPIISLLKDSLYAHNSIFISLHNDYFN